ncbi:MAG: RHS repeat protein, partial [Acidobacteria bacterium]|nr:RHS repeat protein [Acidobacteriota bacterium]
MKRTLYRVRRGCLLAALAVSFSELPATGQYLVHPNHQRGFSAETAYEVGGFDNVNLFNGNLTLSLPIGQGLQVAEGFSWSLSLAYSNQLWDWEYMNTFCDPDGSGPVPPQQGNWSIASPGHDFNGGLGWTLTPGRLYRPHEEPYPESEEFRLVTPDGGLRSIGEDGGSGTTVGYSNDGSYLRLFEIPPENGAVGDPPDPPSPPWHTVEFPSGLIYTFDGFGWCRRIEDRYGNSVNISPPPNRATGDWVFEDSHGRKIIVEMEPGASNTFRVNRVRLPAFGDGVGIYSAEYDFQYSMATVTPSLHADICAEASTSEVDQLDQIILPDGSVYEFDYHGDGMLRGANLPSGGRYEWSYDLIGFPNPTEPTPPASLVPPYIARNYGVVSKREYDSLGTDGASGRQLLGEWIYDHRLNLSYSDPITRYKWEKITKVIEPDFLESYYFFSTREDWTYGLPFTDRVADPWDAGRLLSWYKVDATRTPPDLFEMPEDVLQAGYVHYASDHLAQGPSNQRLEQNRTYFYDRLGGTSRDPCDPPLTTPNESHFVDQIFSNYNGLGRYRETRTDAGVVTVPAGGSVPVLADLSDEDLKITRTEYAWTSTIPATDPWILDAVTSRQVQEGAQANTGEYCIDEDTGRVARQRVLVSEAVTSSRSSSDLVVTYVRDAQGNVVEEKYYGGDDAGLTTGDLCGLPLPPQAEYHMVHSYTFGVRSFSRYIDPTSPPSDPENSVLVVEDLDIDWATGLLTAARDASGLQTSYQFDTLGRISRIQPADDAVYQFFYHPATATTDAWAEVKRRAANTTLLHSQLLFDGLGRVVEEQSRMPKPGGGNQWSKREIAYDDLGRRVAESVLQPLNTTPANLEWVETFYDALGRQCKQRRPDGSVTKVWSQGVQLSRQRTDVRTPTGVQGILRDFFKDSQGRLQKVREISGSGGQAFYTDYDYDAGG